MPRFENDEQVQTAKRWWIERFVTTPAGRSFALREHRLAEGARIKSHVRARQARYDVQFFLDPNRDFILIQPRNNEAAWAFGVIRLTPRGSFYYRSLDMAEQLKLLEQTGE